ncbi:MAG TPA: AAA family ATPase [Ignavibacteria bacterium]
MKLVSASIKKYKSIFNAENIKIDDKITTLVGMNESGKTVSLEALAKSNYFLDDL